LNHKNAYKLFDVVSSMKVGIIGGSGLEKGDILQNLQEVGVETVYGQPSSKVWKGFLGEIEVYIISRHGENHEITPSNVNNRANISALAKLGCEKILATTAVGSLRESIKPGNFVIANQFIDFTKKRETTFFQDFRNGVKHTSLADPFSNELRTCLIKACEELELEHHKIGTIMTIEGPRFSTRAESFMFKQFAHVINMSTAPEAILAREAGVEYAVVAMSTDYDCWKKTEEPVTWEQVDKIMKQNAENVKKVLIKAIENIGKKTEVDADVEFVKSKIRTIPNFPKQGIMFRDITTLLKDRDGLKKAIDVLVERYKDMEIDVVVGIESRGFILGAILADKLKRGFVPIRKKGKLPGETEAESYELEYGVDTVEIHKDAISPGEKVLLIDDLIATGGTVAASVKLIEKLGGEIQEVAFVIELADLKGREKISNYPVYSMVQFEGD
jgi:5'-methylthioadenosine phosphorylase